MQRKKKFQKVWAAVLSAALARELALTKKGVEEAWNLSFER